jgi:hypothetical protein
LNQPFSFEKKAVFLFFICSEITMYFPLGSFRVVYDCQESFTVFSGLSASISEYAEITCVYFALQAIETGGGPAMEPIVSWTDFWETFRLSISISLLGALIGHYSKNGVIQFPLFVIPYERSEWFTRCLEYPLRWGNILRKIVVYLLLGPVDVVLFILGFRGEQLGSKRGYLELGLLGDILIGIGTGVLAKTAVEMAGSHNLFAEVSAAFIAGFAGLSYIRERQRKDLGIDQNLDPSSVVEPVPVQRGVGTGAGSSAPGQTGSSTFEPEGSGGRQGDK